MFCTYTIQTCTMHLNITRRLSYSPLILDAKRPSGNKKMLGQYVYSQYIPTLISRNKYQQYQQIVRYSQYINKYQPNRNPQMYQILGYVI